MASLDDIVTFLKSVVTNIGAVNTTLQSAFPRVSAITGGSFTCAAASSTTVPQPLTAANSFIILIPISASAGTLVGSAKSPYISTRTANTSFVVSTASGGAAAGTESFLYILINL